MTTLHLVSGPSAADAVRVMLNASIEHRLDRLVWFPDNLSVGPLEVHEPAARLQWWQWWVDMVTTQTGGPATLPGEKVTEFWREVELADHLVLWHGVDNAHDSAFFHAMCDKLPDDDLKVVTLRGASGAQTPDSLARQLKQARPIAGNERASARTIWKQLEDENQVFRVISNGKLASAPADYYDGALLKAASCSWTPIMRVVAPVMAHMDIGDSPLYWRIKVLTESGVLVANGDPWLVQQSQVKLAHDYAN